MRKEMKALIREIERNGFVVKFGKGHPKVKTPEGGTVYTLPVSPSDHRSLRNVRAELKRLGVLD